MNYSELVSLALSYADRNDQATADRIDDFFRVTESRINKKVKTMKMSTRASINTVQDQEYYGLPPDFAGVRDIQLNDLNGNIKSTLYYRTPEKINNMNLDGDVTSPLEQVVYTIVADQIQIKPTQQDNTIEIVYYQRLPELTSLSPNNWLSDINPDIYTFGLLSEISAYTKDGAAFDFWDNRFLVSLDDLVTDDADTRWSGPPLAIRTENK